VVARCALGALAAGAHAQQTSRSPTIVLFFIVILDSCIAFVMRRREVSVARSAVPCRVACRSSDVDARSR
jgi:hypothetical protein